MLNVLTILFPVMKAPQVVHSTFNIRSQSTMYSPDIKSLANDSRLLSESLLLPSSSDTGPGGDDLSISELSLSDRTVTVQKPFSLLASQSNLPTPTRSDEGDGDLDNDEQEGSDGDSEKAEQEKRHAAKLREEKLQSDIFILKKLNASFALFGEALQDTGSANQVRLLI